MMLKYLLSKKYREDYSRDLSMRFKETDEKREKIYLQTAKKSKKTNFSKIKKAS